MVVNHGRYSLTTEWQWYLKFAWLPARIDSGDVVWWQEYYHGIRFIFGSAGEDPVILHQYMTKQEFIWQALKES